MAKSQQLNFTQSMNNVSVMFNSSDYLNVIQVAVTSSGNNLTPGSRTFYAYGGVPVSGQANCSFTMTAYGGAGAANVSGPISVTSPGTYISVPTSPNTANVDSGTTNATFTYTTGMLKTLYTASSNDAVVKSINVSSTDSAARIMTLWEKDPSSNVMNIIGAINIPANAGTGSGTTASIDLLGGTLLPSLCYDSNGKRVYPMKAGTQLLASVPTVTASTYISVNACIEEY